MKPEKYLINAGIEPWLARLVVRKMIYNLKDDKFKGMTSDVDKPLGKDVFTEEKNQNIQ